MRIAIVTWSSRKAGGAEAYLTRLIDGLQRRGHHVAILCQLDLPAERQPIAPAEVARFSASVMGAREAVAALRQWHPDVVYAHGLSDPDMEAAALDVAPAVFFAHGYYGTCISGTKAFAFPEIRDCGRRFGVSCLMHYYPRRCGGLSPITMVKGFRTQKRRLELLGSCRMILTATRHMREEYLRHGFDPERVRVIPFGVDRPESQVRNGRPRGSTPRLIFAGRMERVKGGEMLLDALPRVRERIRTPLHMLFVGDGVERSRWIARAAVLQARHCGLTIGFKEWLDGEGLRSSLADSDLLVVPSLWPEPFGLIGPEAGACGLPAAAFDVGGISEWLHDGVNGRLAPANPPSAAGLAEAIVGCLAELPRLSLGAIEAAKSFSERQHLDGLLEVFTQVVSAEHALRWSPARKIGPISL